MRDSLCGPAGGEDGVPCGLFSDQEHNCTRERDCTEDCEKNDGRDVFQDNIHSLAPRLHSFRCIVTRSGFTCPATHRGCGGACKRDLPAVGTFPGSLQAILARALGKVRALTVGLRGWQRLPQVSFNAYYELLGVLQGLTLALQPVQQEIVRD